MVREEWAEWAEQDAGVVRDMYATAPENLRLALDLLRKHAPARVTYPDIDGSLDWPRGRFRSTFGGWKSHRGAESSRPFHICPPWRSSSGEWEAWMDESQAASLRGP
jgi:hypothetical protein